jgi:hypothetical protein
MSDERPPRVIGTLSRGSRMVVSALAPPSRPGFDVRGEAGPLPSPGPQTARAAPKGGPA